MTCCVSLLLSLAFAVSSAFIIPPSGTHLQVNALVGMNRASAVQCWSIEPPFSISQQPGTIGSKIQSIGDIERSTLVFFSTTSDTNAGLHRAPDAQWVLILQGNGVVTLPTTNATLPLPQGDLIIAADTATVSEIGHETRWAEGSVVVQAPFKGGVIPGHTIVNPSGPCPFINRGHDPYHKG